MLIVTVLSGHGTDRSRPGLRGRWDTPMATAAAACLLGFRRPRDNPHLRAQRVSKRDDERELWPRLARGEQAPHAGGVAVNAPRQLRFGHAETDPQRVEFPDYRISLGNLTRSPLIGHAVLRVLHPLRPAALMQATVEHLGVHGSHPSCVAYMTQSLYLLRNTWEDGVFHHKSGPCVGRPLSGQGRRPAPMAR